MLGPARTAREGVPPRNRWEAGPTGVPPRSEPTGRDGGGAELPVGYGTGRGKAEGVQEGAAKGTKGKREEKTY